VQVDPQVLRAFAGQVDAVAGAVSGANLCAAVSSCGDGLSPSTAQWAGHAVGDHFAQTVAALADNVAKTGRAVRGAGDTYEVADDALALSFDGLFG